MSIEGGSVVLTSALEPVPQGPAPYRMRAAATCKWITVSTHIEIGLIIDHGCRIYSEQRFTLSGVVPVPGKEKLVEEFAKNWIAHAGKPSTLWVVCFGEAVRSWHAALERDGLDELAKNTTGDLHSLAADLIEHGIAKPSEPDA